MLELGGKKFNNRLLLGTAKYPSFEILYESIQRSRVEIITVSLRRQSAHTNETQKFFEMIKNFNITLLPNTANCRSVKEAVTTAHMARELFKTNWIKLETVGDEYTLQPDPFALTEAAKILIEDGFEVFPYTTEDLVVADKLVAIGCKILMPWGAPIGSGQGLMNIFALKSLVHRFPHISMIIDAGIGAPSQAAQAMELGFDGVLLNSAVAEALDPPSMAEAFTSAIEAGYKAHHAGLMKMKNFSVPSTPVLGTPFWHGEKLHASTKL